MTDFQALINDLIKAGWTQREIAEEVGCGQPNIVRLARTAGAEPRYNAGEKLVMLHEEVCG